MAAGDLENDECVAERDHDEGYAVAADEDDTHVVRAPQGGGRPVFVTHVQDLLRCGVGHALVVDEPRGHDAQSRGPDEKNDDLALPATDLDVHYVTDGEVPGEREKKIFWNGLITRNVQVFGRCFVMIS